MDAGADLEGRGVYGRGLQAQQLSLVDDDAPGLHLCASIALGFFRPITADMWVGINESPPREGRSIADLRLDRLGVDLGRRLRGRSLSIYDPVVGPESLEFAAQGGRNPISPYESINLFIVAAHDPKQTNVVPPVDADTPMHPACYVTNRC